MKNILIQYSWSTFYFFLFFSTAWVVGCVGRNEVIEVRGFLVSLVSAAILSVSLVFILQTQSGLKGNIRD